jgi:ParB-like chromosome segregation protein Spo0J
VTGNGAWRSRIVGYGSVDPHELTANPRNWRTHPDNQRDALNGVLDEVGWVAEVLVNQRTGFVVDGHLRVASAVAHGEVSVPVRYVDLDEAEERLVLATLDPLSALATRSDEQLTALLEGLQPTSAALRDLLRDLAPPPTKVLNPDDADLTPPAEPITQPGDLWLLGEHRLLCGDCRDSGDVRRLVGDARMNLAVTSPPYADRRAYGATGGVRRLV